MFIWGFLIGTGIIWGLSALLVTPIARALTGPGGAATDDRIDTGYFILVDVLILGITGFIMGTLWGWYFIGIAWRARFWPGVIAFIVSSIIGCVMRG
jgi:hypothetical protein